VTDPVVCRPYFVTEPDKELIRATASRDPLGILPVWSARGRDLVPHLTEQTGRAAGFQLLLSAYGLWERFAAAYPNRSGDLRAFYLLVEQAFARATAHINNDWNLPGRRRTLALRDSPDAIISLDRQHWLLDNQLGTGTYGLYRGASGRGKLLTEDLRVLAPSVRVVFDASPGLSASQERDLFRLVSTAIDAPEKGAALSVRPNNGLASALSEIVTKLPQRALLRSNLIETTPRCHALARLLRTPEFKDGEIDRRQFLVRAQATLPNDQDTLQAVILCESFLAPIENIFRWLCGQHGEQVREVSSTLDVNLPRLRLAQRDFLQSGKYPAGTARDRFNAYGMYIDLSDQLSLIHSLLILHESVSKERGRSPWVSIDDTGRLSAAVEVDEVRKESFNPDRAWRNDYYLDPLRSVASDLHITAEPSA
jgi:hypothetical protein